MGWSGNDEALCFLCFGLSMNLLNMDTVKDYGELGHIYVKSHTIDL